MSNSDLAAGNTRVSCVVPKDIKYILEKISRRQDRTLSKVMCIALTQYAKEHEHDD